MKIKSPSYIKGCFLMEYEKRLLLICIHHFKSDLIYNMDHMRISGYRTLISDP